MELFQMVELGFTYLLHV